MSHETEEWQKIWRKTNLMFQKWLKFGEFWFEHSKLWNICTLFGSFCPKHITFDLKNTENLSFMILKSHAKFEEKLTCGLQNEMKNLANFHQNTWKCQNWYFHKIFLSKIENKCAKNLQRSYDTVMTLKNDEKSEEELTCSFKTYIRNMRNFDSSTRKY